MFCRYQIPLQIADNYTSTTIVTRRDNSDILQRILLQLMPLTWAAAVQLRAQQRMVYNSLPESIMTKVEMPHMGLLPDT